MDLTVRDGTKVPSPAPIIAIGIGCLWLAQKTGAEKELDRHYDQVREVLSSIENLTNLSVTGDNSEFGGIIRVYDEIEYLYPNTYWTRICFDLHIPNKVQERLDAVCGSESISIRIENHYHFPVAYVYNERCVDLFEGSTAVILVRRYLEEKLRDSTLAFGCTGPSPFHANFLAVPGEEMCLAAAPSAVGYREYLFTFMGDKSDALDEFCSRYGDEFSLFYYLHNIRRKSIELHSSIIDNSHELMELSSAKSRILGYKEMELVRE